MKIKKSFIKLIIILLITACSNDDGISENPATFESGFFTVNKGETPFNEDYKSSILFDHYYPNEFEYCGQNIYSLVNNETINGYIEDFVVDEQFAYILVNNIASNEEDMLIVVNKHTFKTIKK